MSGRSQSQRLAKQLRENETTAKNKFPTWDENARAYYSDLKDKDRGGRLTSGSLDHYLYHTYLHKMREERVQKLQTAAAGKPLKESTAAGKAQKASAKADGGKDSDMESSDDPSASDDQAQKLQTDAQSAAAGKPPKESAAAGKAQKASAKADGGKGSDMESSDDPSRSTLEPAPKKSVKTRARKDNADNAVAADAADPPQRTQNSKENDKRSPNKHGKRLCCTNSISKITEFLVHNAYSVVNGMLTSQEPIHPTKKTQSKLC